MARIVFFQQLYYEYPGIEILSGVLKKDNHKTKVIIGNTYNDFKSSIVSDDIIAFSLMTGMQQWALSIAREIKRDKNNLIIAGGPHPTYFPEFIYAPEIDVICRGEGEKAISTIAQKYDSGDDFSNTLNCWVKVDGQIKMNTMDSLISDIDDLPFPDRDIYYDSYKGLKNNPYRIFNAGRGCPFKCSFCFNEAYARLYHGSKIVRFRSPENIIDEILTVKKKYGLEKLLFHDDTLMLDIKWSESFLSIYKKEVRLPFFCQIRADTVNGKIIKLLSEANCKTVSFAIESGNEEIRKNLLNKKISNEKIIETASLLKRYKIKFATFNIIGVPGETIENVFETIDLNIKIGTNYPRCSFLTPYPGTRIAEYAERNGYLETSIHSIHSTSQQTESFIKTKYKDQFINLHYFFQAIVIFPFTKGIIKKLIFVKPNMLFKIWWGIFYFIIFALSDKRGFLQLITFTVNSFKSLFEREKL